jgi:hypothetical protein
MVESRQGKPAHSNACIWLCSHQGFKFRLRALKMGASLISWMEGDCSQNVPPRAPVPTRLPNLSGTSSKLSTGPQGQPFNDFGPLAKITLLMSSLTTIVTHWYWVCAVKCVEFECVCVCVSNHVTTYHGTTQSEEAGTSQKFK